MNAFSFAVRPRNPVAIGRAAIVLALAASVASCGDSQQQTAAGPPPPMVTVSEPTKRTVFDFDEYVGRFVALNLVEMRARVSGYLEGVHFTDGQIVKQGDLLFTISAKLTSPQGATATITQAVYAPVGDLDDLTAIEEQLDEECSGWRESTGAGSWLVAEIIAKDTSTGGREWGEGGQFVVTMAGAPVFQGDFSAFQAYCVSAQGDVPGTIRAVTPLVPGAEPDQPGGWATVAYGFGMADDTNTLSACRITLTTLARAESTLARRWPNIRQDAGFCEVNTLGL